MPERPLGSDIVREMIYASPAFGRTVEDALRAL